MKLFNPEMLILARESRGLTQKELSEALKVVQGTLSKIENGVLLDVGNYVAEFSNALHYPESFFYLDHKIYKPSEYFFRKKLSLSKKEVDRGTALINITKFGIDNLLRSVDLREANLPSWNVDEHGSPSHAARYLREYWKTPRGKINSLIDLAENFGVIIHEVDFESGNFDGLSLFTESGNPIILINKDLTFDRQRLTVAHELGHLIMHYKQIVSSERNVEEEAFEFAGELLMPEDEILPNIGKLSLTKLAELKRQWRTSMASIIIHARRLNAITENQYKYLWIQMGSNGYRKKEPAALDFPKETPSLLKEIFSAHLNELHYSMEDLSALLHLNADEIHRRYFYQEPRFTLVRKAV